jgi:hypothetical protein
MKTMYFLLLSLIITNQAYSLGDQAALATDPHADAYFQRFVGEYSSKQRGCGGLEASVRFRYLGNGLATILVKDFGGLSHTAVLAVAMFFFIFYQMEL